MTNDAITPRLTVTQLVEAFEQAERNVRAAFALLGAAEERLNATFTLAGWDTIRVRGRHRSHGVCPISTMRSPSSAATCGARSPIASRCAA